MTPSDMTALADQLVRCADIVPPGVRATMIEAAAALRAPSPSGGAGAMREALEQRKKEIAADIERFDWKPPTPAWHRAFGELSGINFALAAAPQAQEDEAFKLLIRTFQSAKLPPKLELDISAFLSSHSRPERGDPA